MILRESTTISPLNTVACCHFSALEIIMSFCGAFQALKVVILSTTHRLVSYSFCFVGFDILQNRQGLSSARRVNVCVSLGHFSTDTDKENSCAYFSLLHSTVQIHTNYHLFSLPFCDEAREVDGFHEILFLTP